MAQMTLPTQKQKDVEVAKAQRHHDSLQTRHDNAKKIVDEVAPELAKAKVFLDYVKGMPVTDGPQVAEQSSPEQPEVAQTPEQDEVFA